MQTIHTTSILCALAACSSGDAATTGELAQTVPLPAAKLLIEHNATDEDTGFQIFADGDPWNQLQIAGPGGEVVFTAQPAGRLRDFGMTEMFIETNEPPNDEVSIEDTLARLPVGRYDFEAVGIEGEVQTGSVDLTHAIPRGAEITAPAEDAEVSADRDLTIAWNAVTTDLGGAAVTVTHYQLIVEREDDPPHPGFGRTKLDVIVPASVRSFRVPCDFLTPQTTYEFEVLAIEASGNQTVSARGFSTR